MNKEFVSLDSKKVVVSDEKGELSLRESSKNLVEILENENLKEHSEMLLEESKNNKEKIEKIIKEIFDVVYIISSFIPLAMLIILKKLLTPEELASFDSARILALNILGGVAGGFPICVLVGANIKYKKLKRIRIANESSISILNYTLSKANKKLEELGATNVASNEFIYDRTEVSIAELNDLNTKLSMISECAKNPNKIETVPVGVYHWENEEKQGLVLDEEEQRIIGDCIVECQKVGKRRVLRKNERR